MNILRLVEKKIIRVFLIVSLFPLQSCSNTLIGEKLENSFDINKETKISAKTSNKPQKINEKTKIKSRIKKYQKGIDDDLDNIIIEKSISNINKVSQKSTKKKIFNPQPYRIILRLSGANPSAPAETVTEALRKAGVQFEVEKIERFDDKNLLKNTSLKR